MVCHFLKTARGRWTTGQLRSHLTRGCIVSSSSFVCAWCSTANLFAVSRPHPSLASRSFHTWVSSAFHVNNLIPFATYFKKLLTSFIFSWKSLLVSARHLEARVSYQARDWRKIFNALLLSTGSRRKGKVSLHVLFGIISNRSWELRQ